MLANTYHLALRPGEDVVAALGGLHAFLRLDAADPHRQRRVSALQPGPDDQGQRSRGRLPLAHRRPPAGAFARARRRHPRGAWQRRGDGAGPRRGAAGRARQSSPTPCNARSAGPSAAAPRRDAQDQALFGIVQGGLDPELRVECAEALAQARFSRLRRRRAERRRDAGRRCTRCSMSRCRHCRRIGRAT